MENRHRLRVIGITYNQIESGVYALILQEDGSDIRIPIIIGYPEAQSIECRLQDISTPRPLTHDIMATLIGEFDLKLVEVFIRKLPNGVFAADMIIEDSLGRRRTIDSRSSDAVALALRLAAPIYTSSEVIREAGFTADSPRADKVRTDRERRQQDLTQSGIPGNAPRKEDIADSRATILRRMSVDELTRAMDKAVEKEDYEEAARIKSELDRRNKA